MPYESKAQSAAMHAAAAGHSTLGIPKKAAQSFVKHSQHGEGSLKGLPAKVKKRAEGGPYDPSGRPRSRAPLTEGGGRSGGGYSGGRTIVPLRNKPGSQAGLPTMSEAEHSLDVGTPLIGPQESTQAALRDRLNTIMQQRRELGPGPRGYAHGGPVGPKRMDGGAVDRRAGGKGVVPYARGGRMGGPPKGAGTYLTGERGPEALVNQDGSMQMVGQRGPELLRPTQKGAVVPNHELKRLGKKYSKRVGGGQVGSSSSSLSDSSAEPKEQTSAGGMSARSRRQHGGPVSPDTPQAGFRPSGKQVDQLARRGLISMAKKEKHLGKYGRGANSKGETETTPIDAASR
jgi:hypothetical protein